MSDLTGAVRRHYLGFTHKAIGTTPGQRSAATDEDHSAARLRLDIRFRGPTASQTVFWEDLLELRRSQDSASVRAHIFSHCVGIGSNCDVVIRVFAGIPRCETLRRHFRFSVTRRYAEDQLRNFPALDTLQYLGNFLVELLGGIAAPGDVVHRLGVWHRELRERKKIIARLLGAGRALQRCDLTFDLDRIVLGGLLLGLPVAALAGQRIDTVEPGHISAGSQGSAGSRGYHP